MSGANDVVTFDLATDDVRDLNRRLQRREGDSAVRVFQVRNPAGAHAVAVGMTDDLEVTIEGHVGYYCAGMNQAASVWVEGNVGTGVAENMMSGLVWVKGDASQSAGATGHGGLLVIEGDASARCGISLKGLDIVVKGSIGHMGAFMAQAGRLVVCGDCGPGLGDSLYEAQIFVAGEVDSLGADCEEQPMTEQDRAELAELLTRADVTEPVDAFRKYGSARRLYHFKIDNVASY